MPKKDVAVHWCMVLILVKVSTHYFFYCKQSLCLLYFERASGDVFSLLDCQINTQKQTLNLHYGKEKRLYIEIERKKTDTF